MQFIDLFLHLDQYLANLNGQLGLYIYPLLFIIIFLETGVVATPFLPGDSLLFAAGALAASTGTLNISVIFITIAIAAIVGDSVNYSIGSYLGSKVFQNPDSKIFKKEYLDRTQSFYAEHGNKAVLLGRFFPIIRTFIPFVAGVGKMEYEKFALFNILGGILWTAAFLGGGYLFGNIQIVKENFTLAIFGIILISLLPGVYHLFLNNKTRTANEKSPQGSDSRD